MDFWLSSGAFHFWNPRQAKPATTWEASLDDLMKKQATTLDPAERRRLFVDAQKLLAENLPVLYFAAPKVMLATSARVRGVTPSVLAPHLLWNAERLSVSDASARR
jgi:peptide/nickel transport system substrate-binding protein